MKMEITDNSKLFLKELETKKATILEAIGIKAERYAKKACPVGTVESTGIKGYRGGTLRDSITHATDGDVLSVGSNVEYAPYVELGTGPYFEVPPEWEQFESSKGSGVGHGYVKPRPFLRTAIVNHKDEYETIAGSELKR